MLDKREKLTEEQAVEKFRESMKHEPVPEELGPEKVEEMLKQYVSEKSAKKNVSENGIVKKSVHKIHFISRYATAAAAAVFVVVVGLSAWQIQSRSGVAGSGMEVSMADDLQQAVEEGAGMEGSESGTEEEEPDIRVLGDHVYEQASDYGSVYDVLKKTEDRYESEKQGWFSDVFKIGSSDTGAMTEEAGTDTDTVYVTEEPTAGFVGAGEPASESRTDVTAENDAAPAEETAEASYEVAATGGQDSTAGKNAGYSETNVQTEGVDESDIIKTDGDYIYQVNRNKINIYDIRKEELKLVYTIDITKDSAADSIREIYLQNEVLSVIVERQETEMKQEQSEDVFSVDTKTVTSVETYNIRNRTSPKKIGEYKQDGNYYTSRKKGDIIYLFTANNMAVPVMERRKVVTEDAADIWLPCINGEVVAPNDIYLPEYGSQSTLIGSFNCKNPQQKIDSKMVLNDYAQVYVSQNSIYFYRSDYNFMEKTEIAKFSMEKGKLKAAAAASVNGEIRDTFAINESNGYLRVLTTAQGEGQQSNQVYVLDDKLQLVGQINDLAPGEEIYAARFMGNTGYFVTYRNTDPLFSVDFTDPKNPVVLGELKVTGFSEYLHFWGKDKLLGIGYETDPDTGEQMGVKLSMFDISDPANVKECAKTVLKNVDYTPALYDYKSVLADEEENLIGFATECYGNENDGWAYSMKYLLFAYEDGEFKNLMAEALENEADSSSYRGLFAQGRFFLTNPYRIAAYERENYSLQKEVEASGQ